METPDIIVLTGMSGSGRTQALHVFEDMGYFCIDNLPPRLLAQLAELVGINAGVGRHLAVTCDLRSQGLFDELSDSLSSLADHELGYEVVFLDASDEVLVRRYNENRRRHPIAYEGEDVPHAVARERALLAGVREGADLVIDTSALRPQDLRARLHRAFSELTDQQLMDVQVFSFGFKHGMPIEADLLIDVRFLPNPFYEPKLRDLDGTDDAVARYVLDDPAAEGFLDAWEKLIDTVLPGYVAEGKSQLSIAVGCTGGQHRSVVIATVTADHLRKRGYRTSLSHRDLSKAVRG
ncbi:RNase adapter RapZ [Coriobacteriales bacterium OH1046]|nr:RNase adapter RapZ [Coriobacteriales bacterium OH1046]